MSELDASLGTDFLPPLVSPQAPSAHLPPLAFPQERPLGLQPLLPWTRPPSGALPPVSDSPRFLPGSPCPRLTCSSPEEAFLLVLHAFICSDNTLLRRLRCAGQVLL